MKRCLEVLTLVTASAWLSACTSENAAPSGAAAPAPQAKQAAAAAPVVSSNEVPPPAYNPIGKRDPFRSYLAELSASAALAAPSRKKEPTEMFALDQYRLTGLLTGTSQPKAMVEDPDGKGHAVKIGSHLGKDGGIVTRITSTGLVVTEETRAPTGEKVRVPITIPLPQPELDIGSND